METSKSDFGIDLSWMVKNDPEPKDGRVKDKDGRAPKQTSTYVGFIRTSFAFDNDHY